MWHSHILEVQMTSQEWIPSNLLQAQGLVSDDQNRDSEGLEGEKKYIG